MTSKALTKVGAKGLSVTSAQATAEEQVKTLAKVLGPLEDWAKRGIGSVTPKERPSAESATVAVRELLDTAEKGRKALTKPLLDEKRDIDDVYKAFTTKADALNGHLWKLIQASREEEKAAMIKAAEKEAKLAEKKGASQLADDIRAQAAQGPVLSMLKEQTIVRAEIEDLAAFAQAVLKGAIPVPFGELFQVNQAKVNALVKSGLTMPGVKRVEEIIGKRSA